MCKIPRTVVRMTFKPVPALREMGRYLRYEF
jgi:hypothetical protein